MRTKLFILLFLFCSTVISAQVFNFEKTVSAPTDVVINAPNDCQGFPLVICGSYNISPVGGPWSFDNLNVPNLEFNFISIDEVARTFCFEILESNYVTKNCNNIISVLTFTNPSGNSKIYNSNLLNICISDIVCNCIDVDILGTTCYNNGTSTPDDDYWSVEILVVNNTANGTYWTTDPFYGDGQYGVITSILPGFIQDYPKLEFRIIDAVNVQCEAELNVAAPDSCSTPCDFELVAKIDTCDNNKTPNILSDDIFYVEISTSSISLNSWSVYQNFPSTPSILLASGIGSQQLLLGPFLIQDGNWTLSASLDNGECPLILYIETPEFCSGCHSVEINNITCFDNGTPFDFDDYWTFDLLVEGGITDSFKISSPFELIGAYGINQTVTINEIGPCIDFVIFDKDGSDCNTLVSVCPPAACSSFGCDLQVFTETLDCEKKDTPNGPVSVFSVNLQVSETGGKCWNLNKLNKNGSIEILGQYTGDQKIIVGPFNEGEEFTLEISLCDNPECFVTRTIISPFCLGLPSKIEVRANESSTIKIFPNPLIGEVLDIKSENIISKIVIYNVQNEIIYQLNANSRDLKMNLDINPGLYFLVTTDLYNEKEIIKFIKM